MGKLWQPSQSLIWNQRTTIFGAPDILVWEFGHTWFSMTFHWMVTHLCTNSNCGYLTSVMDWKWLSDATDHDHS